MIESSAEWNSDTRQVKRLADRVLRAALEQIAVDVRDKAQDIAEKKGVRDTGYLIDQSWHITQTQQLEYVIWSDADYSAVQEFGSVRGHKARPFLQPAADQARRGADAVVREYWKVYIGDATHGPDA
jgi:hypothetical protein